MSEYEKYLYAARNQGFGGSFEGWQNLSKDERDEYELGAAGVPTA